MPDFVARGFEGFPLCLRGGKWLGSAIIPPARSARRPTIPAEGDRRAEGTTPAGGPGVGSPTAIGSRAWSARAEHTIPATACRTRIAPPALPGRTPCGAPPLFSLSSSSAPPLAGPPPPALGAPSPTRTVAPTAPAAAAAAARPAVIGYVFARDRVLEPHELDRAGKLTHVNFAFANVVGRARGRGLAARRREPEGADRPAAGLPAPEGPRLGRRLDVVEGLLGRGAHGQEPPPVRGLGRRLRRGATTSTGSTSTGSTRGCPGDANPHRPEDKENFTALMTRPARGPRPRGRRASREAPAPDVRGGCLPRLRRPHRDGEGAGRRRLREPDDVRLPRRQSGRAGRTPREPDARARPTRGSTRPPVRSTCSSRPASPPRSSSSVCRSTGAPGKASSRRTASTAGPATRGAHRLHRTPLSRRSPARTAGSASGTLRRRRRTCGTRRSRRS